MKILPHASAKKKIKIKKPQRFKTLHFYGSVLSYTTAVKGLKRVFVFLPQLRYLEATISEGRILTSHEQRE